MTLPCITDARRFDVNAHLPFHFGDERVGWIRAADVALLARWPDVFEIDGDADTARVTLAAEFDSVTARSAALGAVIGALAAEGRIPGWRDETYAIRNAFDAPPLAYIERAASRFFGTMTYAVHLNGVVEYAGSAVPLLWIARRSDTKATDPGMLDNVVAGGIGWGLGVEATLQKECWEEAGIAAELAACATPGRTVHVLQSLPEGTQAEQIFVYDLALPEDFVPHNQDGEVGEHRLARIDETARWIEEGQMTVDASLATLDLLLRRQWIDEDACEGIAAIFEPPTL
ncbi:8-oxo-dGTP pyrophosphatase MutT (NUDIX family) [Paraburkholderia tropica]|uniref:NUDIX hydrolase n=1 Tax=Paraburkholderia tropica TaxID=92647 RepID=UPI0016147F24|nr:NUDIX hydrolase family protein [Paraburkholderia tropica]MBB2997993.1 8-oxo-dGTP pyrophosphatase MutT (NUDIX family) [Paraburkholderia tropica]MBB6317015.1 8-oxo-dGTP pyrophosphatase MutT (NUDIX family) [Paraburkholderia tropica]